MPRGGIMNSISDQLRRSPEFRAAGHWGDDTLVTLIDRWADADPGHPYISDGGRGTDLRRVPGAGMEPGRGPGGTRRQAGRPGGGPASELERVLPDLRRMRAVGCGHDPH